MSGLTPVVLLGALILKLTSFLKYLTSPGRDLNAALTQACAWAIGIGVMFLLKLADITAGIVVANKSLSDANGAATVLFGLVAASAASTAYDFRKARDGSDSAAEPPLTAIK